MTLLEEKQQRLKIALSEVEEALDWYDDDDAFVAFAEFQTRILAIVNE